MDISARGFECMALPDSALFTNTRSFLLPLTPIPPAGRCNGKQRCDYAITSSTNVLDAVPRLCPITAVLEGQLWVAFCLTNRTEYVRSSLSQYVCAKSDLI